MRGRGLKLFILALQFYITVAPHAGAWIETDKYGKWSTGDASPPMRGRGLKPLIEAQSQPVIKVAPQRAG